MLHAGRPEAQPPVRHRKLSTPQWPPVTAQRDDNIWRQIIPTPSLLQSNAQRERPSDKGVLSHCIKRDWFLYNPEQELL
jgi:hypothetical protein